MSKSQLVILILSLCAAPAAAQHQGLYGPYPMTREASGTAWQPESSPHEGLHLMAADWRLMLHGSLDLGWDRQGGPRGGDKVLVAGMAMGQARRALGPGTLGLKAMLSPDPLMGPSGYPLLLQTGETADGVSELVDRQHPHDLFMELAASYSLPLGEEGSVFIYGGLPGEPALGPAAFMHRGSGLDLPFAPISHHWLDSTHITFGVVTLGGVWRDWKMEGSAFHGREPDEQRWGLESPKLDSWSGRLTWNPASDWSLQASYGSITGPEQLAPGVDVRRFTASASFNRRFDSALSQTTAAYGLNTERPGPSHGHAAYLVESALRFEGGRTLMARAEAVEKHELFAAGPLAGRAFTVEALSLGGVLELFRASRLRGSLGLTGTLYRLPSALRPAYGGTPAGLFVFTRLKLS